MRDVFPEIIKWVEGGERFAAAIVTSTWGSSPRKIGSWMVVNDKGEFHGSVSGGCVESAVIQEAMRAIESGRSKNLHFGVADETAWEVGLACGGEIDVFLRPFRLEGEVDQSILRDIDQHLAADDPFILAIILSGPEELVGQIHLITNGYERTNALTDTSLSGIVEHSEKVSQSQTSQISFHKIEDQEIKVFHAYSRPPLKLVIVGGVHISIALARYAKILGYRVQVVDPRGIFATSERFAEVEGLVKVWPDQGLREIGLDAFTAVAVLSHDPKLDDPALRAALRSDAFYVGALGSRKTQKNRRERLAKDGLSEEQLERLHGPIGMDLGGSSPEEIALSIMAEIVLVQSGITKEKEN